MTREEAIAILQDEAYFLYKDDVPYNRQAFEMAIKALSQEPCDDVVSREMALKECHDIVIDGERYRVIQEETLLGLPSVTQKSGKWILLDECANSGYYCSNCQKKLVKEGWSNTVKQIKYCPNCGSAMKGE